MRRPVWSVMRSVGASSNRNPPFQDFFYAQGFSPFLLQGLPDSAFPPARVINQRCGLGKRMENLVEESIADVSIDHTERMAVPHAGPGIMLLTSSMRLLYKDRRAGELCQQIIRCQDGKAANGVLPPAVASLVDQIQKLLKVRTDPKDWEQIQLRRVVNTLHSSVLLCGTALMDQTNAETRILIVISEVGIGVWQDTAIVQAKEMFQ